MEDKKDKKFFVFGLDSAPPELLFGRFLEELPHIKKLVESSLYGPMKSCIPAITIPAWMVMATGKTPGELGLYGFRHRKGNSYDEIWIANSLSIKEKAIWDYLGEKNMKSILVGVPPTYPPKKINGYLVSCFITPSSSVNYTFPRSLRKEVENLVGEYIFDVIFRKENRDEVKEQIWEMTKKHFEVVRYLAQEKDWNYFEFVEIGLDRIHHAFWKYFDPEHHLYKPGNKYENVVLDYYKLLDKEIGKTLKVLDEDTAIAIVSDHGAKRMKGCFAINQWLIDEGYLKVKEVPREVKKLEDLEIIWEETVAWAWGGYYARVFINVKGREPKGVIPPEKYEEVREELSERISNIRGPNGEKWHTKVFYPENIYPEARGDKPDLMVYFDDLYWRSAGTVGWDTYYLRENDTGPDDAVHAEYGVFLMHFPEIRKKEITCSIYDFAPTVLKYFEISEYKNLMGTPLI